MIGAIAGDIIGSVHEGAGTKTKRFPLFGPHNWFTDDTVLTVAVADSILRGSDLVDTSFDVSCQGSVPQAIVAFLEAADFEDAIRNAISLGGDADTMACIAGGMAEAYWGVPDIIEQRALGFLDGRLRQVVDEFNHRFRTLPRGSAD